MGTAEHAEAVEQAAAGQPAVDQPMAGGVDLAEALRLLNLAGISLPRPDAAPVEGVTVAGNAQTAGGPGDLGAAATFPTTNFLQQVIDGLCTLSSRDGLTGLANRRTFNDAIEREIDRSARTGEIFGLLMVDVDHFKKVNDQHGHLAGDVVLKTVANTIAGCFRSIDVVARYGGEEFAVILPNASESFLSSVAERSRLAVENSPVEARPGVHINLTVSIGTVCSSGQLSQDAAALIEIADGQLYEAKRTGRNRVCSAVRAHGAVSIEERAQILNLFDSESPTS